MGQLMSGYPDLMLQLQVSIRKKLKLLYHKVLQIKQATVQMFL